METTYEQDLAIDETALDIEWLGQPQLMLKYTGLQASARRSVDKTKEKLNVVKAGLDKTIRSDLIASGDKMTETIILNTIIIHKDYKKVVKKLINVQYEYEMVKGAVQACDQRKTTLENLVKLHGQQYFAGPKVPRDLFKEAETRRDRDKASSKIKMGGLKRNDK